METSNTFLAVGDDRYGAQPDQRGPLGGGPGYAARVNAGDFTVTDLEGLIAALGAARSGQTVYIPGATEIDLTTFIYMEQLVLDIAAGVTLAGDRGHAGSAGAVLTSDHLDTKVMLRATGPGVRVTGLRLRGPNTKRYIDHHTRAFGPGGGGHEYYYRFPTQSGLATEADQLEVDNCEISGFGLAGVHLHSGQGHHVHHCYIHHCQYQGLGYGVAQNTASALIECNLFDSNRHSIAGTGRPGCGYVARHNVELGTSLSHCFDMHGGRDRKDGTDVAGTALEIHHNTFRAPERAVVVRGVPEERCLVHHNWFVRHASADQAVRAAAGTQVLDNAFGPDGQVIP